MGGKNPLNTTATKNQPAQPPSRAKKNVENMKEDIYKNNCWGCKRVREGPSETCPKLEEHWKEYEDYLNLAEHQLRINGFRRKIDQLEEKVKKNCES